jgi:hypothetical protein
MGDDANEYSVAHRDSKRQKKQQQKEQQQQQQQQAIATRQAV